MKKTLFGVLCTIVMLFMIGCSDPHLGMRYVRFPMAKINNDSIYCYEYGWALDATAYYITKKKDPCLGMDAQQDICLGKGETIIYYQVNADTLKLYISSDAVVPKSFAGMIQIIDSPNESFDQQEKAYKNHQLNKVDFEGPSVEIPCNLMYDSTGKGLRKME